jgi:drug/metabolite transporter (DMT)-like permease
MAAENAPITLMSLTLAVQGVVAALVGTMFLGERLTAEVVVGFLIIFAALMLATRERHEPAPEPAGFLVGDIED